MILDLRDYFKPISDDMGDDDGDIYSHKSWTNWKLMVRTLRRWNVIDSDIEKLFLKLESKRHKAIHFNIKTGANVKAEALEAIKLIQEIIQKQFGALGIPRYFMKGKGEVYIKKEVESDPFVKTYFLPQCHLVSPYNDVESVIPPQIVDRKEVEDREISDEEFIKLREDYVADKFKKKKSKFTKN